MLSLLSDGISGRVVGTIPWSCPGSAGYAIVFLGHFIIGQPQGIAPTVVINWYVIASEIT